MGRPVVFRVKSLELIQSRRLCRGLIVGHRVRSIRMPLGKQCTAEHFLRARFGILRRGLQRAEQLLLRLAELLRLQGGRAQLRGDQPDDQRQILLEAFGANLHGLRADAEGDFGAHIVQLFGDRKLVEARRAAVEHHAGQGRNGDVAGLGHRIAGGQRSQNHDHVLHVGVISDQVDARHRRPMALIGHRGRGRPARQQQCSQGIAAHHLAFSAGGIGDVGGTGGVGGTGMNQPVVA